MENTNTPAVSLIVSSPDGDIVGTVKVSDHKTPVDAAVAAQNMGREWFANSGRAEVVGEALYRVTRSAN